VQAHGALLSTKARAAANFTTALLFRPQQTAQAPEMHKRTHAAVKGMLWKQRMLAAPKYRRPIRVGAVQLARRKCAHRSPLLTLQGAAFTGRNTTDVRPCLPRQSDTKAVVCGAGCLAEANLPLQLKVQASVYVHRLW
jgi:hypothetical protein